MRPTLFQASFGKIKIAKNQLTGFCAEGRESVNRPVDLSFPKACSMIVPVPYNDMIRLVHVLGNFNYVARTIAYK